jgi:hypothetical protein
MGYAIANPSTVVNFNCTDLLRFTILPGRRLYFFKRGAGVEPLSWGQRPPTHP